MQNILKWKSELFSNNYSILWESTPIGSIKSHIFKNQLTAELNGKSYVFKQISFFKTDMVVSDYVSGVEIGYIKFSPFMSKATLTIKGTEYIWRHDNMINTKCSLHNYDRELVSYKSKLISGEIQTHTDDPLFVLSGLCIHINYTIQMTIGIVLSMITPFILLLNR